MPRMLLRPDRRTPSTDRRGGGRLTLAQKPPRRHGDRRESSRLPRRLFVREAGTELEFEPYLGDVSVGGLRWAGEQYPASRTVEVRFVLPNYASPVEACAEVIAVDLDDEALHLRGVFRGLDVRAELALARLIEDRERLTRALDAR